MSLPVLLELDKIALKVTMLGDCVGASKSNLLLPLLDSLFWRFARVVLVSYPSATS